MAAILGGNGALDNTASLAQTDAKAHTMDAELNSAPAEQTTPPTETSVQVRSDIAPTNEVSDQEQTDSYPK